MADEYIVTLKANTKPAEQEVEGFQAFVQNSVGAMGKVFAGVFAGSQMVSFFNESTKAALESEKAVKQFNFALKAAGVFTNEVSQGFQDYAASLQAMSGVQDEVILEGAARMIQVAQLSGQELNRTLIAGLRLAKDRSIDASEAFEMLTRAAAGNTMAFSKMGLQFAKNASDAERFQQILTFIETKMQTAELNTNSYKGAMTALNNSWADYQERTGKAIIENPVIIGGINMITKAFLGLQVVMSWITGGIDALTLILVSMVHAFGILGQAIATLDFSNVNAQFEALRLTMNQQSAEVNASFLSYDQLVTKLNTSVIPAIQRTNFEKENLKYTTEQLRAAEEEYHNQLVNSLPATKQFALGFRQSMMQMSSSVVQLGKTIGNTFVSGLSNSFASMGEALVNGEDMFGAFGKSILKMLGNIAIQMGQFYIAAGIAAMWLNPAQGIGMIAGGAALSFLGGVLQALGGGGGAAPAANGAVGSGSIGASTPLGTMDSESVMNELTQEQERQSPNTGVQIVVQGNILDRRETGLAIAEIINESFYTNGTQITANA